MLILCKRTHTPVNYRAYVEENGEYSANPEVGVLINVMVRGAFCVCGCQSPPLPNTKKDMTTRNHVLKLKKDNVGRFTFSAVHGGDHELCIKTNQTAWFRSAQKAVCCFFLSVLRQLTVPCTGQKIYYEMTIGEGANDLGDSREKLSSTSCHGLAFSMLLKWPLEKQTLPCKYATSTTASSTSAASSSTKK